MGKNKKVIISVKIFYWVTKYQKFILTLNFGLSNIGKTNVFERIAFMEIFYQFFYNKPKSMEWNTINLILLFLWIIYFIFDVDP